jgi:hypothetical protein
MARRFQFAPSLIILLCGGAAGAPAQSLALVAKPAATTAPSTATAQPLPRTADGHPDFQGYWINNSVTPLERPKDLAGKAFFTPEEAAAYAKRQLATPQPTGPGTYADVHYNMAQYGLDKSQNKVATSIRTSLIIDPPDGHMPPMTPEARARNAARDAKNEGHEFDSAENRPLRERCITWGIEGPPMMPVSYNGNLQIVQSTGYVAILEEMIHDVRMIPTDGSPHLPANMRLLMGDSRGHWEGETLVVDITNFTDKTAFQGSSEKLHVVERFRRVDENTLLYQFTVDDPSTWTRPWSVEMSMSRSDGPIFEYACHEGNYGMANNLSGARAEEKKKAQEGK